MPTPSRPPPTDQHPDYWFARRLQIARQRSGLRLDEASVEARRALGASYGPSRETIRRYEIGMVSEENADPVIVAALAEIYGVSVGHLSWVVAQQVQNLQSLVRRQLRRPGFETLKDGGESELDETELVPAGRKKK
jgi:transcriptional regulator with XRE-family HTH domain